MLAFVFPVGLFEPATKGVPGFEGLLTTRLEERVSWSMKDVWQWAYGIRWPIQDLLAEEFRHENGSGRCSKANRVSFQSQGQVVDGADKDGFP